MRYTPENEINAIISSINSHDNKANIKTAIQELMKAIQDDTISTM